MPEKKTKRAVDWEAIERDYRAGVKTLRVIGEEYGVSHVAITKKAKKEGWTRDLLAKIQAKADELVTKEMVTKEVTSQGVVTERQIVEANAEVIKDVVLSHRKDIGRTRGLVVSLLAELEAQTDHADLFAKLGEFLAEGNSQKMVEAYNKVVSLPGRVDAVKKLADALKTLIVLERQSFRMDEEPDDKPSLPDDLMSMSTQELRAFAAKHSKKLFGAALIMVEETTG